MSNKVILFPGVSGIPPPETEDEKHRQMAGAVAEAMRDYRNAFGVEQARTSILAQMYVLGIISDPSAVFGTLKQQETI